jgi:hypothetical protein
MRIPAARLGLPEVAALVFAAATVGQQQPTAPAVVDDARVREIVAKVQPAVEAACGRKFAKTPAVGIADIGDVHRALRDDLEPYLTAYHKGQPRQRIQRAIELSAGLAAASMLGKYGFRSREVYVLPHLVGRHLEFVKRGDANVDEVLHLVIAHELVHALQDQELDLGARAARFVDCDQQDAFAALTEGHAVFCSERAAATLGLQGAVAPMRAVLTGERDPDTTPGANLVLRRVRGNGAVQYLRSARFFAAQHEAGGDERLWELLRESAPSSRRILCGEHPATARVDLSPHFAATGTDERLAGKAWTIGRGTVSELQLLGENLPRGEELIALLPRLRGSGEWFAVAPTPISWRSVYALAFADDDAAARYVELVGDVIAADMKDTRLEFVGEPAPTVAGAAGRRWTQAPKRVAVGTRAQLVCYRAGRHVLQVTCTSAPLSDAELVAFAEALLAKLDG